MVESLVNPIKTELDEELELRPQSFDDYIGQKDVKGNLEVFVKAAKMRNETLDHTLLYGPPGLGKTTLAHIIANEMGTNIRTTSGPTIEKPGDLAAILSTLEPGDVLFIDEIHRIPKVIEEILYPAMEDFCLDIVIKSGEGSSRSIRIDLPPFTLVGATTRAGDIGAPLRDRFGIISRLEYYSVEDVSKIIHRTSRVFSYPINESAAHELAKRSRKTPRIANRLFKRVRDFAMVSGLDILDEEICKKALDRLKVDHIGLDETDHVFLNTIIDIYEGGPVGLEAVASSIGEDKMTLEDFYEPYLMQIGFLKRTKRGRMVTYKAYEHLGMKYDKRALF